MVALVGLAALTSAPNPATTICTNVGGNALDNYEVRTDYYYSPRFLFRKDQDTDSPFGQKISFEKTGLQETIDSLTKGFDHGVAFNIQRDSVDKLFRAIKNLDKFDSSFFNLYADTCDQIKIKTWKCKTSKCVATRLIKRDFDWRQGDIPVQLTEYEIFRLEKPNYINVKIINGIELHELKVQDKSLDILKESVMQDIEQGFNKFSRQKSICTDSVGLARAEKELREKLK